MIASGLNSPMNSPIIVVEAFARARRKSGKTGTCIINEVKSASVATQRTAKFLDHSRGRTDTELVRAHSISGDSMERPVGIARGRSGRPERWIRVPKAAELVAADLRQSIVEGALKEGDTLPPEAELLRRFGVSRPTLREAYRLLESEGLITVQRGLKGGALVHAPSEDVVARHLGTILRFRGATLQDVYDARMLVEPPAAGLLARTRSPEVLEEIERILAAEAEMVRDSMAFSHEATLFHEKVLELAGNHTLAVFGKMLSGIVDFHLQEANVRDTLPKGVELTGRAHRAHERLVELIRQGDAATAESFWRTHLEAAEHFLLPGEISDSRVNVFR